MVAHGAAAPPPPAALACGDLPPPAVAGGGAGGGEPRGARDSLTNLWEAAGPLVLGGRRGVDGGGGMVGDPLAAAAAAAAGVGGGCLVDGPNGVAAAGQGCNVVGGGGGGGGDGVGRDGQPWASQLARHDSLQALSGMAALESEDAISRSASPASPSSSSTGSSSSCESLGDGDGTSTASDSTLPAGDAASSTHGEAGAMLAGAGRGASPGGRVDAATQTGSTGGGAAAAAGGGGGDGDPLSQPASPKGADVPDRKKPKKKPKTVTEEDTPRDGSIVVHGVDGDGRQRLVRMAPGQTLLALSGLGLKGVSLDALTTSVDVAHAITEVTLAANELDYVDLSPLAWCPRLVALSLNGNALLRVDLAPLAACKKLERIWLHGNQLERVDLAPLAACTALRSLYLDKNRLDDVSVDLAPLARLPTLRSLRLGGNKLGGFLDVAPLVSSKLSLIDVDGSVTLVASTAAVANVSAPALRKRAGSISWVTPTPRPLQKSSGRRSPAGGADGGSAGSSACVTPASSTTGASSPGMTSPGESCGSLDGDGGQAAASALPPTPPAGVSGVTASVILPANSQTRRVGLVRSSPPPSTGRSPPSRRSAPARPAPPEPAPRTFVFSGGGSVSPPSPFVSDGSQGLLRHPKRDAGGLHGMDRDSCLSEGSGGALDGNAPRVGSLLSANGVPVSAADSLGLSPPSSSGYSGMLSETPGSPRAAPAVIHVLLIGFRRLSRYAVEDTLVACGRVMIDALTLEAVLKDPASLRRAHVVLVQAPGIDALQRVARVAGSVPVFVIGSERYRNTPAGDAAVAAGSTFCHDPLAKDDGHRIFSAAVRYARNCGGTKAAKAAAAAKADAASHPEDAELDAARIAERMAVEAAFADLGNEASLDELGDVAKAVGLPRCAAPLLFRAARQMQNGRGVLSSRVDLESFMRLWRTTLAPEPDTDARLYVLLASPRSPVSGGPGAGHSPRGMRPRATTSGSGAAAGGDLLARKMSGGPSHRSRAARSGGGVSVKALEALVAAFMDEQRPRFGPHSAVKVEEAAVIGASTLTMALHGDSRSSRPLTEAELRKRNLNRALIAAENGKYFGVASGLAPERLRSVKAGFAAAAGLPVGAGSSASALGYSLSLHDVQRLNASRGALIPRAVDGVLSAHCDGRKRMGLGEFARLSTALSEPGSLASAEYLFAALDSDMDGYWSPADVRHVHMEKERLLLRDALVISDVKDVWSCLVDMIRPADELRGISRSEFLRLDHKDRKVVLHSLAFKDDDMAVLNIRKTLKAAHGTNRPVSF